MSKTAIDYLNIGLIIFSLIVAFKIPFELFLFSYAFLGPLHYLTEINWLSEKGFFVKQKKIIWILGIFGFLICIPPIVKGLVTQNIFSSFLPIFTKTIGYKLFEEWVPNFIFMGLTSAIAAVSFKKWSNIFLVSAIAFVSTFLFAKIPLYLVTVGVFVPTIIHVYLFTALFMLFGALKEKSKPGMMAFILLGVSVLFIILSKIDVASYTVSEKVKQDFDSNLFSVLNMAIARFLIFNNEKTFYLLSETGLKIQIFIAFAYTYHYLNWFSKTSIIKWHQITKKQFLVIVFFWLISSALYFYNYHLGFLALLVLSSFHVMFEFPLNYISAKESVKILFFKKTT